MDLRTGIDTKVNNILYYVRNLENKNSILTERLNDIFTLFSVYHNEFIDNILQKNLDSTTKDVITKENKNFQKKIQSLKFPKMSSI